MRGIKGKVEASKGVKALLLLVSNLSAKLWGLASSSCFLIGLAKKLLQKLYQAQDSKTITIEI